MFCLISSGVRLDWSCTGNESRGTENLDGHQILEKNSVSQPSDSTAVNETQRNPKQCEFRGGLLQQISCRPSHIQVDGKSNGEYGQQS